MNEKLIMGCKWKLRFGENVLIDLGACRRLTSLFTHRLSLVSD